MITDELINERGKTHGEWYQQAACHKELLDLFRGYGIEVMNPSLSIALIMIACKLSRILAGDPNFRDHWDDIAGYAKLAAERCAK